MARRSVVVVVQNLPVPLDRRVWSECRSLRDAGYEVSVICPKGAGDASYENLDGVHLYKYRGAPPTSGFLSYVWEFLYCWIRTALLSVRVFRRHRFQVMQACNPPDTYWLLARFWRIAGVRFVFDHHDLNPELYVSRFGEPKTSRARAQLAVLTWLERRTHAAADHVIATNESYRRVAVERGRVPAERVTVVRSGPDTRVMRAGAASPELRHGKDHLLAYVGVMGPQDNVDVLLEVMRLLRDTHRRDDVHLVLMGFGDCLQPLRATCAELSLDDVVSFTGRVGPETMTQYLSTASLGLAPDLKTPLNDLSTHNKVMEYMAFGLPVVAFDLVETRVSAADAAVYLEDGDLAGFAAAVDALLDDPGRRSELGARARARCADLLDWRHQTEPYVSVFDRVLGLAPERVLVPGPDGDADLVIDLRDGVTPHAYLVEEQQAEQRAEQQAEQQVEEQTEEQTEESRR